MNDLKLQKNNEAKVAKEHLEAAKELAKQLEAGKVEVAIKVGEAEKYSVLSQIKRLQQR